MSDYTRTLLPIRWPADAPKPAYDVVIIGDLRLPGVQGALFADVGSSWLESMEKPEGTWGSYGAGFRMSLGAQAGALTTRRLHWRQMRFYFALLVLLTVAVIGWDLARQLL